MLSRSWIKYLWTSASAITSRSCCSVQAALGCVVTFTCAKRRVPCSMTTNTYNIRNVAVTETKRSQARTAVAWFLRNVDQRRSPRHRPGGRFGKYLRTVRGEIRIPSLSSSSLAIRFAPQHVLPGYPADQLAQFYRDRWSIGPRLHSPEQSPASAMPANHRCRLHDHQRAAPIKAPGQ